MAQNVLEFTSESVHTILSLLDDLVVPKISIDTLTTIEQSQLNYRPTSFDISALLPELVNGNLCSVMIQSAEDIRYGLLTGPKFNGQDLSVWMGTIEFQTDEWLTAWNRILADRLVSVVCVGLEEGIDLTDSVLTIASFPWDDPWLIAGAVRGEDGSWETRGP